MSNFQNTLSFCEQIFLSLVFAASTLKLVSCSSAELVQGTQGSCTNGEGFVLCFEQSHTTQGQPFPNTVQGLATFLGLQVSHPLFLGTLFFIFSSCPLLSSGLADPELVSDQKLDKVSFVCVSRCVRSSLYVARSVYDSTLLRKTSHLGLAGAVVSDSKLSGLSYYFWRGV